MPSTASLGNNLDVLACPACRGALVLSGGHGSLKCTLCQKEYPVIQGIPHFIRADELSGYNRRFARLY